ncbi:trypsin-like serine peptidase [Curvivirga aplysinae]|uniref:trypsin-like serine peptidase n=1 Tax=Curvivirga aplysinae TaxID=2529852 RepID=UPI0012BCFC9A|nr:trypsin-like serine protease [Curvivirga aplysinae]MTI11309.1 trypsin-like serine protease [Curvivirga aplysinae]
MRFSIKLCLSISLLSLTFVHSAFATEFTLDIPTTKHREIKNATSYPYSAIGTVNWAGFSNRSSCTGTLIAEDILITAAHCVINPLTDSVVNPQIVHFSAGYQKEKFLAHTTGIEIISNNKFKSKGKYVSRDQIRNDWALIKLKDPIGKETGYLGWGVFNTKTLGDTINSRGKVLVAGYPRDRIHALTVETKCGLKMSADDQVLLRHSCQLVEGDSGGPIAIFYKNYATLIGINAAVNYENKTNYAVTLEPLEKYMAELLNDGKAFSREQIIHYTKGQAPTSSIE